jgi:hypothetical protein
LTSLPGEHAIGIKRLLFVFGHAFIKNPLLFGINKLAERLKLHFSKLPG